ncbi:hypothetical protein HPB50_003550 [Hyalomma asiaticum]|uniref:Uncharacterized protein n=1 Tax=Hyalomma asiaticum TaxID=266040 RepID=A0ACB7SSQ8_HYAAI|nr:hypothetical protein HPB50_003550 [Hyalomma asiaticum]
MPETPQDLRSVEPLQAAKKNKVGKISFREYTASLTTAVIQKKRLAIAGCLSVAFLLAGASLLFLLLVPGDKHNPSGTWICDTDECLRAFYYLDRAGDLFAQPCEDFHRQARYVCYHWRDNDDLEQMSVTNFYSRLDNNLRFDSALELGSESGGLLFARAYRSCHQFLGTSGDAIVAPEVTERLNALVRRFSLKPMANNLTEEIVRTSVTEGVDVLYGVSLAIRSRGTYPSITKGKSLREKLDRKLGDYLSDDIVSSFIPLANNTMSELVKIDDSVHKTFYGKKPTTDLHDLSMLSKLTLDVSPPPWSSLFEKYLNVSGVTKVLVTDFNKIRNVMSLLSKVSRKEVLGAYLSLQAVADVLFLFIQKKYFFFENTVVTRNCLRVTCLAMSHFCDHVTSQLFGWSSETKNTIQELYDGVLNQYVRSGSLLWSAAGHWLQIAEDLGAGSLVTLPTVPTDVAKAAIDRYETLLKDWPDSYPAVHSALSAAHKMVSVELPLQDTHGYLIEAYLRGHVFYSDMIPGLLVPTALTTAHMTYSSHVPIKIVNNTAAEWDEAVASTLFAWTLSMQLALGSLLAMQQGRALIGDSSHTKAAQRTLMRRFCLLSCGSSQDNEEMVLDARSRCLVPLVGLPEFAEAFNCPVGTVMNPKISCKRATTIECNTKDIVHEEFRTFIDTILFLWDSIQFTIL